MTRKSCRIAFLIDDLSYGGAQRQLALLAASLPEHYVPVVFCLSRTTEPFGPVLRQKGIEVFSLRRRSHLDVIRFFRLLRGLSRSNIDIIHGILDASNAYAFLAGRLLRKPAMLSLRNERLRIGGIKARLLHIMYRKCARISTNSKAGELYLLNTAGVAKEKIVRVRNLFPSVPPPARTARNGDAGGRGEVEVIGFVGRLSRQKNVDLLIHAFAQVARLRPHARLVLFGRGKRLEILQNLIRNLGLGPRVAIREPVPEILDEMRKFHCLVLPSAYEGFPNVVIEALAVGTPVVASAAGDVSDLVVDGRTGVLLSHPTAESLAAAITRVLSDPEITKRARSEGPRLVRENFSVDVLIDRYVSLYEDFCRK